MLEVAGGSKQVEGYSSFSRLVALKPRQVLLAEQKQQGKQQPRLTMTKKQLKEQVSQKTDSLKDDQKLALLHSVVKYISDKGFAKTYKKFLKEAQVKDGAWKENSFDLEDIYGKYLETCRNGETDTKGIKEQEESVLKDADAEEGPPSEIVSKKKKKKKNEGDNANSSVPAVKTDNSIEELKDKEKKKKSDKDTETEGDGKRKKNKDEENHENVKSSVPDVKKNDSLVESTDKKKKKKKKSELTSELHEENGTLDTDGTEVKEKKKKKETVVEKLVDNGMEVSDKEQSQSTLVTETDKKSKKRKRPASDESKETQVEEVVEEFKKRKTEGPAEAEVNGETNKDNGIGGQLKVPKQFAESDNGNVINNRVGKFSDKKSAKKQRNGSAEPKTVNAFQRVKVDAVEFADERLQDNSYWAKSGAETGYGAKAQEILGQVKGRDFRHEKTKKKRGSYRGGQIDLQSHSIKFNYSDEE